MSVSEEYINYILDQLSLFGRVQVKKMFGGAGLYCDGIMFALIADDTLYLKVDESNRVDFEKAECGPFKPYPDKPASMSYYQVPVDILENRDSLSNWAGRSFRIARQLKDRSK